jgi:hypothetical protein
MKHEGPLLEAMTHRLSECPEDFLAICDQANASRFVVALMEDFFRRYGHANPIPVGMPFIDEWMQSDRVANNPRHLGILCLAIWLYYDPWFSGREEFARPICHVLQGESLREFARLVKARSLLGVPDRREELVRICLNGLELRPQAESIPQATDRLMSLSSVERDRILKETAAAEKRAREVREAMAKTKARESVSRYGE